MEMNYCRRCGKPLTNIEAHIYKCAGGHMIFANASPTVGVFFVTDDNQVILSRRGIEPNKGKLDSFGGFLDGKEAFKHAAERELLEESTLSPGDYEPLQYLCSAPGDYRYGGETNPVISVFFWSRITAMEKLAAKDDVAEVVHKPLFEIDLSEIGNSDVVVAMKELQKLMKEKG